jgi:Asp-tRNA(Asn)/Glu-tRNA(Gln) amidotransferase B subunit
MKHLVSIIFCLCLCACGTTSSVKIATQQPDKTEFAFQDQRAADQRLSRTLNSIAGQNSYFGDDNLSPSPPELLKAWLHNKLAAQLKDKQVTLLEFVVNVYDPAVSVDMDRVNANARVTPNGAALAPLTGLFIHGIESVTSEKVVQVKIQGKVQTDEFSAVESENFRGRVTESNIQTIIIRALDKAVADVKLLMSAQQKAKN